MPWQSSGGSGGPWGGSGGSGGGGPWGRGGAGGGNNSGGGGGQRPPDFEDMIRKGQERLKRLMPGGFGSGKVIGLLVIAVIAVWLLSGLYRVESDQEGVVLVFGEYIESTEPGLHWNWPAPIGEVETPSVESINAIEVGFRTTGTSGVSQDDVAQESLMLTGDQNIIDIDFNVVWRVSNARKFLFNIREPFETVKTAAESAMRDIIGQTEIQRALTESRGEIEAQTQELLQSILDSYGSGILVVQIQLQNVQPPQPVADSFNDVQRALQDRDRLRNEAEAYRNDILPRARGEAQQIIQEANAYRESVVAEAEGEANRFLSVYEAYAESPDTTRQRLYLETLEEVYGSTEKILMDSDGAENIVPYLPLNELNRRTLSDGQPVRTDTPSSSSGRQSNQSGQ
ncbi:FtsH protease activity modulator HflK [Fodinicurvata fenggangensis]|uniref:FtsH protease activity modulator HflK n=1 Tax=Fodinicurvata fenggangensis TaxID=1121830 RepID=UPI00047D55D0|nr:FtsH protease activity modulator HflK [Fodinicurvata fenggangensis]